MQTYVLLIASLTPEFNWRQKTQPEVKGGHIDPPGKGWACFRSTLVISGERGSCPVEECLEKILWPQGPTEHEGDPSYFCSCLQPSSFRATFLDKAGTPTRCWTVSSGPVVAGCRVQEVT